MSQMLEYGREILQKQPFSELIGAELTAFSEGSAQLTLEVKDHHKQQHGFIHGGVVSYLADNTLTYAGGSVLGNVVTLEYKINYVRPALGNRLIANASVLSKGKNTATCECKILSLKDNNEKLVAVAQGTIYCIG